MGETVKKQMFTHKHTCVYTSDGERRKIKHCKREKVERALFQTGRRRKPGWKRQG